MQQIGNVADRVREREVMDRPDLDQRLHQQALTGLARLNWLSGSVGLVWPPIAELGSQLGRPLSVLDLATGGGDIPLGLWRRARRTGLDLEICGVDVSSRAVEFARTRAQREGAAVRFVELNALDDELPRSFDAVVCSLFLHHLDDAEAVTLLAKMAAATRHLVLVNDLARSRLGLLAVYFATRVLTTSSVVWGDGPRQSFYWPAGGPQDHGPTTAVRMQRYAEEALPLAGAVAAQALDNAALPPAATRPGAWWPPAPS